MARWQPRKTSSAKATRKGFSKSPKKEGTRNATNSKNGTGKPGKRGKYLEQAKQGKHGKQGKHREQGGEHRRPLVEMVDYIRSCCKVDGLGPSEEALLSTRALEEISSSVDRLRAIAKDQRGSKPLEKLIKKATTESFALICPMLLEDLEDLATNQYASHVLETALRSWAERLGQETKPPVEPVVSACTKLNEGLWPSLVKNASSAHVLRQLLMALGGYAHEEGKEKLAARAGLLPQTKHEVAPEIAECRRQSAASLIKLIRQDYHLCLNSHASPVIQLLLRLLRDCNDRALLSEACAAVVGATKGLPSMECCEALTASAAGSRVLEAVLEAAGAELFAELFSRYFRTRLSDLATGSNEFGPFLSQKVADALREGPQLQLALSELDFVACLGTGSQSAQHMVVLKFLEASLRLRSGLKQAAGGVFRALGLQASSEYHRTWSSILSLTSLEVPDLLEAPTSAAPKTEKSNPKKSKKAKKSPQAPKPERSEEPNRLRRLPAGGAMLLAVLLRFPAETVAPVTSGLSKMLSSDLLVALAKESRTARVLEAALAPSSALGPRLRLKLAAAFKGAMATLGPHHIGGWVCAALWRTSLADPKLRESFAKELLGVEDQLRAENFAVWKVCGLHQVKVRSEEWMKQQKKAGKVQALFADILAGEGEESAKAAKLRKARADEDEALAKAAAMEDPTLCTQTPALKQAKTTLI